MSDMIESDRDGRFSRVEGQELRAQEWQRLLVC